MLWDTIQHFHIATVRETAERAEKKTNRTAARATNLALDIKALRERVESLTLVSLAIVELLKQETNLTDELIRKKIEDIDLLDGELDGMLDKPPIDCPGCNRRNNARRTDCLYCGDELTSGTLDRL